jgi:hypothetical protein
MVAAGSASNIWCVNSPGSIYKWNGSTWTQITGTNFATVTAAADGSVWALKKDDTIWQWTGSTWAQRPGTLRWIAAGSAASVWGVSSAGTIYRWNGSTWIAQTDVPAGGYKGVAAAADGSTILLRNDGTIWKK